MMHRSLCNRVATTTSAAVIPSYTFLYRVSGSSSALRQHTLQQRSTGASPFAVHFHTNASAVLFDKISLDQVKQLRKDTDAPLGQCKKALEESDGDMEKAKEWLRKKGVQTAQKKQGREATQGLVSVLVTDGADYGVILEVNTETDFVTRNEKFQGAVSNIVSVALESKNDNLNTLLQMKTSSDKTVENELTDLVGAIGENIRLRRVQLVKAEEDGVVESYIHNSVCGDAMGQMGAIVAVKPVGSGEQLSRGQLRDLARSVAMHVTAIQPKFLDQNAVPAEAIQREKEILREKALNEGKNAAVIDKIVDGQLRKYFQDVSLVDQPWAMDDKISVSKWLKDNGITVTSFARMKVGQADAQETAESQSKVE